MSSSEPILNGNGPSKIATNGSTVGVKSHGLHIVIIGAGIGGLTAAIFLRKQGHRVTLLEQSRFANEVGAAMHLAPNANGLLRRIGILAENIGANAFERVSNPGRRRVRPVCPKILTGDCLFA
jgi:thioredoxin reductase